MEPGGILCLRSCQELRQGRGPYVDRPDGHPLGCMASSVPLDRGRQTGVVAVTGRDEMESDGPLRGVRRGFLDDVASAGAAERRGVRRVRLDVDTVSGTPSLLVSERVPRRKSDNRLTYFSDASVTVSPGWSRSSTMMRSARRQMVRARCI